MCILLKGVGKLKNCTWGSNFSLVQLWTNKVINFDNLRTRIFIKILTSDSDSETLKLFKKGVALIFPRFFGMAKFLGTFNTPKSLPNWLSLDQFCTICDPDVVDVWKNEPGSNYIFFRETLTWKGYNHMTVSAKFPLSETDFWSIFRKDFGGIEERKQKGVDWYIFHISSYFFRHWPNFWGIKHLYRHFWKFCSLELIKEINRNSFIPLSTNSDAFLSPKKSVSKFDDFVCPQL